MKEIAAKQEWDLEEMRILKLDVGSVRFGRAESYEIRLGLGKTRLLAKFSDQVSSWKKPSYANETSFGSLINGIASMAAIRSFKIAGPFDLMVEGDAQLSLSLPVCSLLLLQTFHLSLHVVFYSRLQKFVHKINL